MVICINLTGSRATMLPSTYKVTRTDFHMQSIKIVVVPLLDHFFKQVTVTSIEKYIFFSSIALLCLQVVNIQTL